MKYLIIFIFIIIMIIMKEIDRGSGESLDGAALVLSGLEVEGDGVHVLKHRGQMESYK